MKVTRETRDSIWAILYIFYKLNMLSRSNLQQAVQILEKEAPENIATFLMDEVKKMTGVGRG